MGSCTDEASPTQTVISGRSCGWIRLPPSKARGLCRTPLAQPSEGAETMPINPNAEIEISAFRWVPEFAQGVVRDLRARWALEEASLDYRVRLLDQERPPEYLLEQPFDQVPCFSDSQVKIFETGAIVQYLGEKTETLLPRDPQGRYRAIQWTYAALNSVEPALINLLLIDIFFTNEEWAKLRRPGASDFAKLKLRRVSEWLGDKEWLEGRFTIGDLIM